MRILHISKYDRTGGIETFVRDLTAEQARQGHDVSVVCHHSTPRTPTDTRHEAGVAFIRCAILFRTGFAPVASAFPSVLRAEIERARPDVIHLHLPNPAVLFQSFLPANIPLVIHWHADVAGSSNLLIRALYPLYRVFEQRCLARADSVIVTSPPYLESSLALTPWRDKCSVVPLGLDLDRYPRNEIPKPSRPLVLSVGRLTFYKGFEYLVQAAALMKKNENADFIIVGSGPEQARIQGKIERLGVSNRVTLAGYVTDAELRKLLQKATLFCLPSIDRGEAFGVTLLEAMRYGLPLVSTAIPGSGTGWVNQHNETGLVVPPTNPEALVQAIRELTENPELRERFGQAARERLEDHFLIKGVAREIEEAYASLGAR